MLLQTTTRAAKSGRGAGGSAGAGVDFARRRAALIVTLAFAGVLLAPVAAQAGTLSFFRFGPFASFWSFAATSGATNTITVNPASGGRFILHDSAGPITIDEGTFCTPGGDCGCTGGGTTTVTCSMFDSLTINAGNQNDTVTADPVMSYTLLLNGQDGVDQLHGGAANDIIDGGTGNDTALTGEAGNDTIRGGSGADSGISGGGGTDTLSYNDGRTTGVTASLTSGANSDLDTFGVMEALEGTNQADTLSGTGGANALHGLGSGDVLIGGAGADTLDGGDGADTASYEERATAVTAALGGANTDGDVYTSIRDLTGGGGDDTLTGDAAANTLDGGGGDDVLAGAGAADSLIGGSGRNTAGYDERATAVTASLAPAGPRPDGDTYAQIQSLRGGAGNDTLTGDAATNRLEGGAGDDVLIGAAGDDDLIGGSGRNTASYQERTSAVTASLAPNGPKPDSDVYVQIQNLRGGAGGDTLTGDGGPNVVEGGAGADTINVRDGAADTVNCGAAADTAAVDLLDTITACEALRFPDSDGDGSDDSRDCARANPAIHPGATEILDNAVDENCDGIAAITPDGDGDGFNALLDCQDDNPRIRPGAREIPGNDVDENCDRLMPDFPLIGASIAISTQSRTRFTRVLEVVVTAIPKGGRIELRCKPPKAKRRACPFKRIKRAFPNGRRRINLARRFKGRRLPVGTVIELRVTAPETIGKVSTRRVARSSTKRRLQCLRPGAKRPSRCPNT